MRDDGGVAQTELPAWLDAATAAAVRLAAEAGAEVDDVLEHGDASPDRLTHRVSRLEQSAEVTEVATDLAGLLWAECEDVPLIATILEEPASRAALEAVAEARRLASRRLADGAEVVRQTGEHRARAALKVDDDRAPATHGVAPLLSPLRNQEAGGEGTRSSESSWAPETTPDAPQRNHEVGRERASSSESSRAPETTRPAPQRSGWAGTGPAGIVTRRRPGVGAVVAGGTAAAAILVFGRRIRRA